MTRLIIVRHGQSTANKERRLSGQSNVPLTELGHRQAQATAKYLLAEEKIDAVWCSDLLRAFQTASYYLKQTDLPVRCWQELREVDVGEWSGLLMEERDARYPEELRLIREDYPNFTYPGGESSRELFQRAKRAMLTVAAAHEGQTVAVFCHGGVARCFECFAQGMDISGIHATVPGANCSVNVYEVENGTVRPILYNFTDHLETVTDTDADHETDQGGKKKV